MEFYLSNLFPFDTAVPILDLNVSNNDDTVSSKFYDKQDDFKLQ